MFSNDFGIYMPITPFHFGPGVLFKAFGGPQVSWTSFVLANGLVDLEPIVLFLTTGIPDHRFFHTFPGITVVGLFASWPGIYWCRWWLIKWNQWLPPSQHRWFGASSNVTYSSVLAGAMLGVWSHLILDSVMHWTMQPFWPFSQTNPFKGQFSVETLHVGCILAAGLGLILMLLRKMYELFYSKDVC
ncbi:MAG: metal-dependent hydrolase [Magnetococcales bacterium]|nr:metal-dependent hydrolase [Magnetococcales bacterium]